MKTIVSIAVLLLSVACFSTNTYAQRPIKISKAAYTIQSPAGWSVDSSKQMGTDLILFSMLENGADRFRDNVNVLIQNLAGKNIDLTKYTAISESQIKAMAPDASIEVSTTLKKANTAFQKIIYTATQSGFKLKFEQYYVVTQQAAYVITLTTEINKFELYKTAGEAVLNSFVLK